MKPTLKQEMLLRKYLTETLRYRETYEEVYDHMLSALEPREVEPEGFYNAVNQIIWEDFGGHQQLHNMELKAEKAAAKQTLQNWFTYALDFFKWPGILYTAFATALIYLLVSHVDFNALLLEGIFVLIIMLPGVLNLARYYGMGYRLKDTKKSIRDAIFIKIAYFPIRLFVVFNLLLVGYGHTIWLNYRFYIITAMLVLAGAYVYAFIKLYKKEFKTTVLV